MISAIVLAAGQATRFGECKQLVRLDGKPLLEHVLDNLRGSAIDDVVVVLGAHAEEIRAQVRFANERIVLNPDYAEGMSTSIQAGLRALPPDADAAMIVLGDQPFVSPRTLNALLDESRRAPSNVIVPTVDGFRGNPVIVPRPLFAEMMEIRGDIGCRSIFGNHPEAIHKVPVDDRGIVKDIDTRADLNPTTDNRQPITPSDLTDTIASLQNRAEQFAVATVVRAERPTSSKPGDKAVIALDGTLTGWIGGSCAHDIVVRNALDAIAQRAPRLLSLSSASPQGREGIIDVPMQCYSGGALDVFIEPNLPKPHIVVVGYETIARAVARLGSAMQFFVTVVDPLAESVPEADQIVRELNLDALPLRGEVYIVIATHGRYDEDALEQAVRTPASYIALVASPKRAGVIRQLLQDRGVSEEALGRVKAPAGLDIGAEGAEEIALSIVAEIVQKRHAAKPAAAPQPVDAIDPICQMTVRIEGARYTAEHEGRRYYFCCAHCQHTFEKAHVA